jgi:tRNA(Ile)-lysidine synthase
MKAPYPYQLEDQLAASWPPQQWRDLTVLLAVSGGADSVALTRVMTAVGSDGPGRLCVAHFNHRLRGDESVGDEAFVVALCRQLGLPCEVGQAGATLAETTGATLEEAARDARYEFLRQTAERLGARYVRPTIRPKRCCIACSAAAASLDWPALAARGSWGPP